jgi:DNA-binding ferritin-like protein
VFDVASMLDAGPRHDIELIADMLRVLTSLTEQTAAAISGDLAADSVSQSIVIDLTGDLDKQAWLLAAQR